MNCSELTLSWWKVALYFLRVEDTLYGFSKEYIMPSNIAITRTASKAETRTIRSSWASGGQKKALMLNVPRRVEHSESAVFSVAVNLHRRAGVESGEVCKSGERLLPTCTSIAPNLEISARFGQVPITAHSYISMIEIESKKGNRLL
jgi:hypothetical protein